MVLLDHFANKSNTFQHTLSLSLSPSLSLSLSRSPISSHFLLGSLLPPTQDTMIPQLKVPCWRRAQKVRLVNQSFPLKFSFEQHSCTLKQIFLCGARFLLQIHKGSCTNYVIAERGGVSPNDYSIT